MADIINLRRARKAKARQQAEAVAGENRVTFGLCRAERSVARAETELAAKRLAAHRRESDDGSDPPKS